MRTILRNIGQLVAVPPGPVRGSAMARVPILTDAALVVEGERISWFGPQRDAPNGPFDETIDACGGCVTPGLVDCHTHVVFAGDRACEFIQRIAGATYEQIMQAGGGIRSSVRSVRAATIDDLVEQSLPRLQRMLVCGTTTVEIKSGYGLSPDDEIKLLRATWRLSETLPIEIVSTFLGAHTTPPEFDGRPEEYLDAITSDDLLTTIRDEKLARFADVFCERGAFTVEQSRRFLENCTRYGMKPKIHAEQLSRTGGMQMAVEIGAVSADHLECIHDDDLRILAGSNTIPVLLPGCNFFIGGSPAPARKMIDANLPVALATDCNPGSSMIESLGLVMSLAASLLRMSPIEALVACTANAAAALAISNRVGAIAVGYQADLLMLDAPRLELWPYQVGVNPVRTVFKRGRALSSLR